MSWRNGADYWGAGPRLLHWATAIIVVVMWVAGSVMVDLTDLGLKFKVYQLHKSFGVVVFTLALLRLVWRLADRAPPMPPGSPRWERFAAGTGHALLYLLLLAMPLTGYLMSAASPLALPTVLFGVVTLPHLIGPDADAFQLFRQLHGRLSWLLLAVVAVHVLGALKHHFVSRDDVLLRMLRTPR